MVFPFLICTATESPAFSGDSDLSLRTGYIENAKVIEQPGAPYGGPPISHTSFATMDGPPTIGSPSASLPLDAESPLVASPSADAEPLPLASPSAQDEISAAPTEGGELSKVLIRSLSIGVEGSSNVAL